MFRFLLVAVLCLHAASAQARCTGRDLRPGLTEAQTAQMMREVTNTPFAYGNHWIATKNDRTVHVIGTMHVNDPRLRGVMRRLEPTIANADAVLFEITNRDFEKFWNTLEPSSPFFFIQRGATLPDVMSEQDWSALQQSASILGMDPRVTARLRPWVLSMLLSRSSCGPRGPFADNGLDSRIETLAIRNRIPIGSLERPDYHSTLEARRPLRDRAKVLLYELRNQKAADSGFITIREAYFEQKVTQGLVLEKWRFLAQVPGKPSDRARLWRQYDNDLLAQRNRHWIPRILKTPGKTIVVAVGAAHLPGRSGVLNLLKRAGYTLKPARF